MRHESAGAGVAAACWLSGAYPRACLCNFTVEDWMSVGWTPAVNQSNKAADVHCYSTMNSRTEALSSEGLTAYIGIGLV